MISIKLEDNYFFADFDNPVPIYLQSQEDMAWTCFGIGTMRKRQLSKINGSVGCRCEEITFCPHANTTHLETSAHALEDGIRPNDILHKIQPLMPAYLSNDLSKLPSSSDVKAVVYRSGVVWEASKRKCFDFTGTNPPFVTESYIENAFRCFPNFKYLLVDLPSVDPESDGGELRCHKAFFNLGGVGIIELCSIPNDVPTGQYALSINPVSLDSDAVPCAPILYPLSRELK